MTRRINLFLLSLAMLASLVVTNTCSRKQRPKEIRISIDMWVGFGPWIIGKEKGLFEKRGVNVIPTVITGTGEKNAALVSNRVDGRSEGLDSIVLAGNQGVPGVVVLALDASKGADGIVASADIKTIADLKGKRVGYQSGLPGHFFLLYMLHRAGLTEADISSVILDSAAASSAFMAGQLDAAVTWEPWLSRAIGRKGSHLLASTRDNTGVIVDVLAVHPEFLRNHPKDIENMMLGWFDSVDYWRNNRTEANGILATYFGLERGELEEMLKGVEFLDLKSNLDLFGTSTAPGKLYEVGETAGEIWSKGGVLSSKPKTIQEMVDAGIVRSLARTEP